MKLKKVEDFLKENKDLTVYGLAWSMLWRGWVLVMGFYFVMALVIAVFTIAFGY